MLYWIELKEMKYEESGDLVLNNVQIMTKNGNFVEKKIEIFRISK